jgi:hypothetical protein
MADSNGAPNTVPHTAGNGQCLEYTPAQLATKYGAGNVKTPTANFTFLFQGQHMNCLKNIPVVCLEPGLLAAMIATGKVV